MLMERIHDDGAFDTARAKFIILRALCGFHSPMELFAITMDVNAWVAAAEPL